MPANDDFPRGFRAYGSASSPNPVTVNIPGTVGLVIVITSVRITGFDGSVTSVSGNSISAVFSPSGTTFVLVEYLSEITGSGSYAARDTGWSGKIAGPVSQSCAVSTNVLSSVSTGSFYTMEVTGYMI